MKHHLTNPSHLRSHDESTMIAHFPSLARTKEGITDFCFSPSAPPSISWFSTIPWVRRRNAGSPSEKQRKFSSEGVGVTHSPTHYLVLMASDASSHTVFTNHETAPREYRMEGRFRSASLHHCITHSDSCGMAVRESDTPILRSKWGNRHSWSETNLSDWNESQTEDLARSTLHIFAACAVFVLTMYCFVGSFGQDSAWPSTRLNPGAGLLLIVIQRNKTRDSFYWASRVFSETACFLSRRGGRNPFLTLVSKTDLENPFRSSDTFRAPVFA